MKLSNEKTELTATHLDIRVRERYLLSGVINQKTIDEHLAALPDTEEQAETIDIPQPALGGANQENDGEGSEP